MHRHIIDDDGEILEFGSHALRSKLFGYDMREDDGLPLLRNLGFIDLRQQAGGVLVTFRPKTVSQVAFVALNYWLWDNAPGRIVLRILDQDGCDEIHASRIGAVRRMQSLIDLHQRSADELYRRASLPLDMLRSGTPLHRVLSVWRVLGPEQEWGRYRPHLTTRFVVLRPDPATGSLVIHAAGPGLRIPDPAWASSQVGRRMDDVPDRAYGRWVADSYGRALCRREPLLEAVDAMIDWPRNGRVRSEYVRLILPVLDEEGALALLGVSDTTDSLARGRSAA